jgi:ABC-type sugar transport system ATPase subunit
MVLTAAHVRPGSITFDRIEKRFPGVAALDGVSFEIAGGACHAIVGENGAGKSTLGKILAGIETPTAGRVLIDGQPVAFRTPRDALRAGVGVVHQELLACPNLSVAENLCLAELPGRWGFLDRRRLFSRAETQLAEVGLQVDPALPLSSLTVAQDQLVQIATAVGAGARILVFDEPTSALGRAEVSRLFTLIRRLRGEGATILYASHRLEEVFDLCDSVTVLRDGRHVATRPTAEVGADELVRLMVGRDVKHYRQGNPRPAVTLIPESDSPPDTPMPAPRLSVRGLSSPGRFESVDLDVAAGEVVGLAGLVGAGRTELLEALYGLDRHARGTVHVDGRPVSLRSPRDAQRQGITLVPEDRKRHGLALGLGVRENLTLSVLSRFGRLLGWIDRRRERAYAADTCRRWTIRASHVDVPARTLSGGNQQKIVIARSLSGGARVLLIDEPTRGVDVGAKEEIHGLLLELARNGAAILLASSDLPELLGLSDRILVLRSGRLVAGLTREEASAEATLRLMVGV